MIMLEIVTIIMNIALKNVFYYIQIVQPHIIVITSLNRLSFQFFRYQNSCLQILLRTTT
jgi:hypothetical protein